MEEYIDILDRNGQLIKSNVLKSEAHINGWYHNTIHLWLYTKDHKILLQQRSHKKKIHPLLWDVSVAGHVDSGEELEEALIRETKEEIGLDVSSKDLKKIGVFRHETHYDTIKDYEFHHTYIAELKVKVDDLIPQPEEVEALKLVSFEDYLDLLEHSETNLHFIASNKDYYLSVLKAIKDLND